MPNKRNGRKTQPRRNNTRMSPVATEFLKCAFAPVDFANEIPMPVPDASGARVTVKRHKLIATIGPTAGSDTYIVVPPVPGKAFYSNTVAIGTLPSGATPFNPTNYPDTPALMPPGSAGTNFTKFRYVSNYIELVPTINAVSWSGSVTAWKGMVSNEVNTSSSNNTIANYIQGMTQAANPSQSMYVAGNNLGLYMTSTQVGPWNYSDIMDNVSSPAGNNTATDPTLTGQFTGIGNLQTMFIRLTGTFSYTIKVGCCVEYVVNSNSALYEYSRLNNNFDQKALIVYQKIASELPLAVTYFENADFWKRVLTAISRVGGALSVLPGPAGIISGGVSMTAGGLSMLL